MNRPTARRRRPGRPPVLEDAELVSGHVPAPIREKFVERCKAEGMSLAEGLRRAIAAWLGGAA